MPTLKEVLEGKKEEPPKPPVSTPVKATTTTTRKPKEIALDEFLGIIYDLDTSVINNATLRNHAEKSIEMLKTIGKNQSFQASRIKGILTLLLKHNKIRR